ncbi:type VI secretion system lipoprotein TssJ [Aquabacterium humicola]|uniref:type VI secretion system lipoprotein TssJ n=1 Tax=Aquabacterium humicola TaxID=3237377 RepID=UPI002543945D|nr:type VI secretion system lipoprotein TssJ [Rubrivivax pictus]
MRSRSDSTLSTALRRCARVSGVLVAATACGACATNGEGPVSKALELVGLKAPAVPEGLPKELPAAPRKVTLRLHAGDRLNTDAAGRSLSIVARVYKLKASDAFMQAPYDNFARESPSRDAAWSRDVIESRELVLAPGQRHEVIETLAADASHVAVVALFRAPAEQRWRFVFDARAAAKTGITLGLHGCAMSVAEGPVVDAAPETLRVAGVQCR